MATALSGRVALAPFSRSETGVEACTTSTLFRSSLFDYSDDVLAARVSRTRQALVRLSLRGLNMRSGTCFPEATPRRKEASVFS